MHNKNASNFFMLMIFLYLKQVYIFPLFLFIFMPPFTILQRLCNFHRDGFFFFCSGSHLKLVASKIFRKYNIQGIKHGTSAWGVDSTWLILVLRDDITFILSSPAQFMQYANDISESLQCSAVQLGILFLRVIFVKCLFEIINSFR